MLIMVYLNVRYVDYGIFEYENVGYIRRASMANKRR